MSHFTVLVVGENIEEQLQPFHEYECTGTEDEYVIDLDITENILKYKAEHSAKTLEEALDYYGISEDQIISDESERDAKNHKYRYAIVKDGVLVKAIERTNPNRQWDWYVVGGRWTGFFKLKNETTGEFFLGRPGVFGNEAPKNYADSVIKSDIDFDGMRKEAVEKATERWNEAFAVHKGRSWKSWKQTLIDYPNIDEAREFYNNQDVIIDFRNNSIHWDNDRFAVSLEEYQLSAHNSAIATFAVVKDGEWHERGSMGWWGCVSDEKDVDAWNAQFTSLLDSLPDDTRLTLVDCHI